MFWGLFVDLLKVFLAGAIVIYAGLVLFAWRSEATYRFDRADPARSVERLLVWVGVRVAKTAIQALSAVLNTLEEASADIGEWLLHHRGA